MDQNEGEVRKQLLVLRQLQQYLTEGTANQKHFNRLVEIYQNPLHRFLKINCYPLLKTIVPQELVILKPIFELDLKQNDHEIQLCSLKLIQQLPITSILDIVKTQDIVLNQFLDGKLNNNEITSEFHYEKVSVIHSLLLHIISLDTSIDPSDSPYLLIQAFYTRITENCLHQNREIAANSLLCITNLFLNYHNQIIRNSDNLTRVNLRPLIYHLINQIAPRFNLFMEKVISFEIRIRSKMIVLISITLDLLLSQFDEIEEVQAIKPIHTLPLVDCMSKHLNINHLAEQIIKDHLYQGLILSTYEIDVLIQSYQATFVLLGRMKNYTLVWVLFDRIHQYIQIMHYRKEINFILLNIVSLSSKIHPMGQIAISMRTLEIVSLYVTNLLTRFLYMLICFHNIIDSSIHMLSQQKPSSILGLFSQSWFLNKIKQDEQVSNTEYEKQLSTCMKEEILICMIVSAIQYDYKDIDKQFYHNILLDVLDVSYRMINWKKQDLSQYHFKNSQYKSKLISLSIELYLILLEEASQLMTVASLQSRLQELFSRINSNEINFIPKVKTLLMLARRFTEHSLDPIGKIDYIQALGEFRSYMIHPTSSQQHPLRLENHSEYINILQIVYQAIYFLFLNFNTTQNALKQNILELLSDYNDNLQELLRQKLVDQVIVQKIQDFNKQVVQTIFDGDIVDRDYLTINLNLRDEVQMEQSFDPKEVLQTAYNIFLKVFCENRIVYVIQQHFFEQELPINNLTTVNSYLCKEEDCPNIFLHLDLNSKLITGVSDFVQLYCAHVVDISTQSICLGVRCINLSPFRLDNIAIKLLMDHACLLDGKNTRTIDELPSYQQKQVFYVVKANAQTSLQFSFDVILQDVKTEHGPFIIRAHNYRISLMEFLTPNYFHFISKSAFYSIWTDLNQSFHTSCLLQKNYLLLLKKLYQKPFGLVILDEEEYLYTLSKQNEGLENISIEVQRRNSERNNQFFINVALLSYLMDGSIMAIKITNIGTLSDKNIVIVEIKTSSKAIFKMDQEQLIIDLADGLLEQMN